MSLGKKANTHFKVFGSILNNRYKECDGVGHLKPDEEKNCCNYCYRTLKYETPQTDAKYASRKDLPFWKLPLDATITVKEGRDEIESQKSLDLFFGMQKLADELKIV